MKPSRVAVTDEEINLWEGLLPRTDDLEFTIMDKKAAKLFNHLT